MLQPLRQLATRDRQGSERTRREFHTFAQCQFAQEGALQQETHAVIAEVVACGQVQCEQALLALASR